MRLRTFGRALFYCVAGLIVLVLVLTLAVKLALDRVPAYQDEIKAWVHRQTGFYIRFAHVSPALRWYGPELYFDQLELRSRDDRRVLARAAGGRIAADILQLIRNGRLLAGRVELDSPDVVIARLGQNSFALGSEIELKTRDSGASPLTLDDVPAGKLAIRHGRLTVQNWNASVLELTLSDVNLDLRRDGDFIGVRVDARSPSTLGGTLSMVGTARNLDRQQAVSWSADVRARDISFAGWRQLLPEYLSNLTAGRGVFSLTARGEGRNLTGAELGFSAQNVATQLGEGPGARFDQINGDLSLTHTADVWTLVGRRVRALRSGHHDPDSQFQVTWRAADTGLLSLRFGASSLRAESLLPLTGLFPQKEFRDRLRDIAPTGEWSDAYLTLARATPDDPWQFQVRANFHEAGFAPQGRSPGFRGLSGVIVGDRSGGHIVLDAQAVRVFWPRQWAQAAELDTLKGTLYWGHSADGLLVATPEISAKNGDATVRAKAAWRQGNDADSPRLTLDAQLDEGNAAAAHDYLPREQIAPKAFDWLNRAIIAGHVPHGEVVLQGPIRQFPFRDGSGVFLARFDVDAATLDYAEGWPRIENLSAQVEFRNEGMSLHLLGAETGGVRIEAGDARFADMKTGELEVHAATAADAAAALEFLRATPVNDLAEGAFGQVGAKGALRAKVELFLPFKEFDQRRVLVHGTLDGVTLIPSASNLTATELNGEFDVDGGQVAAADVRGRMLGGAFRVQARAPANKPVTRTQLDFRGTLSGDALRAALGLPPSFEIHGLSDWRAVLKMAPDPARERSLRVSGTLSGLEIKLPEPLFKPYARPWPSWVEIQWPVAGGPQVHLALGSVLRGAFVLGRDAGASRLARGAVTFGTGEPLFSENQVLSVGGKIGTLDLAGWQRLRSPDKSARPLSTLVRNAKLQIDELDYLGLTVRNVALDLTATDAHWRVVLDGPSVAGSLILPTVAGAADTWEVQFARLKVEESAAPASGAAPLQGGEAADADANGLVNPHNIAAINFRALDLYWAERHFGNVQATISKVDDGISLDQLNVTGTSFTVKAQGEWRGKDAGLGRIEGSLVSSDVQTTLKQLSYADVIAAKTGRLDFDLNWVGAPTGEALRQVIGHVQVSLDKGQILGLKPGAGRVLGLASVAALPRHLALDFSDLTDKGLAFDTIRGDFDLRGGDAYTDNVLLKGPAAEIGLIGRVGLKNKDYDQTAVVTGSVGNSLPLAGALAGGPVVGAAVLLFTQVFKQPLRGLARGYYRITGNWDNPVVERIKSANAAPAASEASK